MLFAGRELGFIGAGVGVGVGVGAGVGVGVGVGVGAGTTTVAVKVDDATEPSVAVMRYVTGVLLPADAPLAGVNVTTPV